MNKIMETKKKKYVKPKLTVAEWNFNEAVCEGSVYVQSPCITVIGDENGATHIDHRGTWRDGEITWNNWTDTTN